VVNFRFHLVSLVAVFLALGIGIIVGSTVIDQATVQGLERNVESLKGQRDSARDDRARAEDALANWRKFDSELPAELLAGRLTDVPVLVVVVEGVDTALTGRLHDWLATAKADDLGTITLTGKLALTTDEDRNAMATILDVGAGRRETVQRAALDALAGALNPPLEAGSPTTVAPSTTPTQPSPPTAPAGAPTGGELLVRLRDAGFLTFDAPEGLDVDLAAVPKPATRLVLVSSADAALSNAAVTTPLAGLLAEQPGVSLVAADATPVGSDEPAFAAMIRADGELRQRVSSIDDVSEAYGQVALVLALEDLAGGVVGHYGVTADQLLPSPNR
jgi:copper transport outer membrane protein MctB